MSEEPLWRGSPRGFVDIIRQLLGSEELLLETIDAVKDCNVLRLVYVFYSLSGKKPIVLEVEASDNRIPSIDCLVPAARVYEEEIKRTYGVFFEPCSWAPHEARKA